jgi:phospholipid/cholesterol/gamma-HCH transport system substrate-binding protein
MSRRTEIQVGITVLLAIAIMVVGVTWLKEISIRRSVRVWRVSFEQTGGLGQSDEVQVNGIREGEVRAMHLMGDHVLVELALASEIQLTRDSRVAIRNVGLMGEKVIAVDLRESGAPWTERDTIPGRYEKGVTEVVASLGDAVGAIAELADEIRGVANILKKNGDFAQTMRNFRRTSDDLKLAVEENRAMLRTTMENFRAASQTTRSLTSDREASLRKALDQFASAAEKLDRLSGRLDSLRVTLHSVTAKVDQGQGTLGKLVNDDKLYTDLSAAIQSLKALIADVKANPKRYFKVGLF